MDFEQSDNYILCIYECGGLTKAAKRLGISQPALSMSLSNLEKKLGYEIFDRKSKPFRLTEEGLLYVEFLKKQILLQQDFRKSMEDLHARKDASIFVGGSVIYVESILTEAIKKLKEKQPECRVTVKANHLTALVEETQEGKMDCFISTSDTLPSQFEKIHLKRESIYLCIPKSWEINEKLKPYQKKGKSVTPEMDFSLLNGLEMISLLDTLPLQKEFDRFVKAKNLKLTSTITVNQVATGVLYATKGLGMMLATDEALASDRLRDFLCIYQLPEEVSGRDIYVAYDAKRYQSLVLREFIEILKEVTAR